MSRTYHHGKRRIRVRGIKREQPDLRRLARALIDLARLQAEADAEAEHTARTRQPKPKRSQSTPPDKESGKGAA